MSISSPYSPSKSSLGSENEADACRIYVPPRLQAARWDTDTHSFTEQKTFTDGKIVAAVTKTRRRAQSCDWIGSLVPYCRLPERSANRVDTLKRLQTETAAKLDVLLPSAPDEAFRGEL